MTNYDPAIIHTFVDQLYRQANSIITTHTILGVLIGAISGYAAGQALGMALLLGIIAGGTGYYIGKQKAFALKLQAQTALCQVKIEENTRR